MNSLTIELALFATIQTYECSIQKQDVRTGGTRLVGQGVCVTRKGGTEEGGPLLS